LEYGWNLPALAWLRACEGTSLVLINIQPWRTPVVRTTLSWCVWIANWMLIAVLWIVAIAPTYRIDFLHIMFMGAFTLLILAVGTRVVLSHGGHGLSEKAGRGRCASESQPSSLRCLRALPHLSFPSATFRTSHGPGFCGSVESVHGEFIYSAE
jgi:hypothetical protein